MEQSKAATLLQEVLQRTSEKKLKWQETAIADTFVVAMGGKYTVTLFPNTAQPDQEDPFTVLWAGPASLRLREGDDHLLDVTAKDAPANDLQNLYNLVKTQVYRLEEKAKSVEDAISLLKKM